MILMIDNYDSFTYNLVQYLREMHSKVEVHRNDAITVDKLIAKKPEAIVISPGPGRPEEAGISVDTIRQFAGKVPILGVCLGHQSIGVCFGAKVIHSKKLMHGKTSEVKCDGEYIFKNLASRPMKAMRYHSLSIERETLPEELIVTAETEDDGEIMGIRHRDMPIFGIQFHPESIMTPTGKRLLRNFLKIAAKSS